MKNVFLCLLSLVASVALSNAQTPQALTHSIGLTADVPKACSFASGPTASGLNFSVLSGTNSTFRVDIDETSAKVLPSNDTLTFANAFCNTASTLELTRSDLTTEGSTEGNFSNVIGYQIDLNWAGKRLTLLPGQANPSPQEYGPLDGELLLEITVPADDGRLVPGLYSGTLSLTVTPNT